MKTQKKLFILSLFAIVGLMSCAAPNNVLDPSMREVRYVSGIIHNVYRNEVELTDGSKWRLDRTLSTLDLSKALVVLYEDRQQGLMQGFMYVDGQKYFLSHQSKSLGIDIDTKTDHLSKKNLGYLSIIKSIDMKVGTITLMDNTEWLISGYYQDVVKDWEAGTDIIISYDLNWAINLPTYSKAEVKLLTSGL